ncbi:olefin beta-lactone synthetase OleC [Streptomyces spororaveus]|uniref:Peptide synthase n=1 Tax=Streptomyces spororaveus TaxID=284039 RepID=A0ABQ3TP70_9ACTN|nr:fatty acid CoA ligase family protein [Streptomyces spororaveus]MCM9077462.1 AMP-binding protein [Streptomyces spororaveus]GHI82210.1 peptide synthase [Streptomyces spororaveus]
MPRTGFTGGLDDVERPATVTGGVAGWLELNARAFPDKPAVIHPDGRGSGGYDTLTYGELQRSVEDLARGFRRAGITRGTRTVLMAPPGPELFALCFALFRVGAVPVVVDPGMGVRRMLHCYRAVGAEAFIGPPLAQLVRVLGRRTFAGVRVPVTLGRRRLGRGHTLAALRATPATGRTADADAPAAGDDDLLMIGFTTGSTGPAKGVEYTHRMALSIARQIEAVHGRTRDDVSLVTLPFYGVLDLVYGSTLVLAPLAPARVAQADPVLLVDALERFRVTTMFASPALLRNLAGHLTGPARGRHPLPDLRCVVSGGAPVPDAVVSALRGVLDEKARIHVTYGATEVLPITSIEASEILGDDETDAGPERAGTGTAVGGTAAGAAAGEGTCVGRPVPGTRVGIAPVTDGPLARFDPATGLPAGHVGEILVQGDSVSRRYHRAPRSDAAHKATEDRPGGEAPRVWHRTGDLGHLDAEGRLWFAGRAAQRVRTGRQDLYTVRCEGVFNAHPLVRRTALVGVGPAGAQRPVVCVETEPGPDGAPLGEGTWTQLVAELRTMAGAHAPTTGLQEFLRHPGFPVDIRHNAKIGREELARWAERQQARTASSPGRRAVRIVPLAGWAYLVGGAVWAAAGEVPDVPVLRWLWWADAFLSIGVHAAQIPLALPRGREAGHGTASVVWRTMLYGATWWRAR